VILGTLGVFHVSLWIRRGFWIPRYIHVMALCAAAIGLWLARIAPADAPFRKYGWMAEAEMILILPALVYGAFVLYGGATAAPDDRQGPQ
jgi:hypothetical protein